MVRAILISIFLFFNSFAFAIDSTNVWGHLRNVKQLDKFFINNLNFVPQKRVEELLAQKIKNIGHNELRFNSRYEGRKKASHIRYDQYFKGLPIFGYQLIAHSKDVDDVGKIFVTGKLAKNFTNEIGTLQPSINDKKALETACERFIKDTNQSDWDYNLPTVDLIIYVDKKSRTNNTKLAYKVEFFANASRDNKKIVRNPIYIIDAKKNKVIDSWSNLKTHNSVDNKEYNKKIYNRIKNVGTGPGGYSLDTTYGYPPNCYYFGSQSDSVNNFDNIKLTIDIINKKCIMVNKYFSLSDLANSYIRTLGNPVSLADEKVLKPFSYDCSKGSDYINIDDNGISPANGAYSPNNNIFYFATKTVDMYMEKFGINDPYKARKYGKVYIYDHIHGYENAFAIAGRLFRGKPIIHQQIFFGNGGVNFMPLGDPDIVAHELGHIFTSLHSDLIYTDQSGGINEAFSDIMGMAFKLYLREEFPWYSWSDDRKGWVIGYGVSKLRKPIRYFYNPELDERSINSLSEYEPNINVHYSSGIFNYAYYLMSTKYESYGLDPFNVAKLFVEANVKYWVPSTTFNEAACGIEQSACDLGYTSEQIMAIKDAFKKVGVECKKQETDVIYM